jgi:signal transduction histidine kinase
MSVLAQAVASPRTSAGRRQARRSFEHDAVLELAAAEDLAAGLEAVAELVRRACGATRVEWWLEHDDGSLVLAASAGEGTGRSQAVPVAALGTVVVYGGSLVPGLEDSLRPLAPIVRRRRADEELERLAVELARRNAALEDYGALVAHELKNPLHAALVAPGDVGPIENALDLVETLLEAAKDGTKESALAPAAESLAEAVAALHADRVEITSDLPATLSLPATPLRVILRNLLANAVAAGALHVSVTAARKGDAWRLQVDDDGIGLQSGDGYSAGSGVGFSLSSRIASRHGGSLELTTGPHGGTRATLLLKEAAQ